MCSALGLTSDVNSKVRSELNTIFESSEDEVACIGSANSVSVVPGEDSFVFCVIKASSTANYSAKIVSYDGTTNALSKDTIKKWIRTSSWSGQVSPNERAGKKVALLSVPKDAPEGTISLKIEFTKDNQPLSTQDITWKITRVGFIRSAAC